jgi:hypothetical protein
MLSSTSKSHKKPSKYNVKKKKGHPEDGEESLVKQNTRHPIVCLPEFKRLPMNTVVKRFVCNGGAVSGTIAITDLLNQFMVVSTSVLGICFIKAVRIKCLKLLAPVQTQGTSVECTLQPSTTDGSNNSFNSVPEKYSDTSASIDIPAYLKLKPSIDTPLGSWHFSSTVTTGLVTITAPQGSTMDLTLEYMLNTEGIVSPYTVVIAAATSGTLFSRNILTNFVPLVFTVL